MKKIEIKSTTDYDLFKLSERNRTPVHQHVLELIKSIKKDNLLHLHPIIVNDQMEIISGQHRFLAAKSLGVTVYYIQEETPDDFIVTSNLFQRQGKLQDAIKFYMNTSRGTDYVLLNSLIERLNMSVGSVMGLLGRTMDNSYSKEISMGMFKFKQSMVEVEDIVGKYEIFKDKIKNYPFELPGTFITKNFCKGFHSFLKTEPNWELFMHRLHCDWQVLDKVYPLHQYWHEALLKLYEKRSRKIKHRDEE